MLEIDLLDCYNYILCDLMLEIDLLTQPLMTAIGRSFTALVLIPASWHVSTTDDTSL